MKTRSKRKKNKLFFYLFSSLISKWFVGLNDQQKNMFDAKYLINIHIILVMGMTNIDDNIQFTFSESFTIWTSSKKNLNKFS